ncbi:MAG: phage major tail tube protein [Sphingomonadaceae bacterium]|nr:phage major tail tube protein [Sphingomonadaceae bacterium]
MALPSKLKNLNLFVDGTSWLGIVKSVTPPPLKRKIEGWRGGGMDGEVGVDMGLDGMIELNFTAGGWMRQVARTFGAATHDAVQLRFAGAYQRDDSGAVDAVEITVRGRLHELDRGDAKPGEDSEGKYKMVCSYYKESVNGADDVEIDLPSMVFISGGVDRLADQRAAIGA